jgi:hypothetical protein
MRLHFGFPRGLRPLAALAWLALAALPAQAANNADIQPENSSVPGSLLTGETRQVRIRVYNNGTTTWTSGSLFRLGAWYTGNYNQFTWNGWNCGGYMNNITDGRAYLCNSVAPGGSYDFYFNIVAPGTAGTYRLAVSMVQDGVQWFGESWYWNISVTSGGGGCPNTGLSVPSDRWRLEIFNNKTLGGGTVEQRYDAVGSGGFNFNWGTGRASNCTGTDNFSIRFTRQAYFSTSKSYAFSTTTDDGVRLYVDGERIIDEWADYPPTTFTALRYVTAGWHEIKVEYYENGGGASAVVSWAASPCGSGYYDLADYVTGDSPNLRVFARQRNGCCNEEFAYRSGAPGSYGLNRLFFIKNSSGANWEEFGYDGSYLYRYRDTSWDRTCNEDGGLAFYALRDTDRGSFSRWTPRCMYVGQTWNSGWNHYVDAAYRDRNNCSFACTSIYEGLVGQSIKLIAHHANYVTAAGYSVPDVIELGNPNGTGDHFFYARRYGLVGFAGDSANPNDPFDTGAYAIAEGGYGVPPRQLQCGID